jgi:preprotein translocase subunit YajC
VNYTLLIVVVVLASGAFLLTRRNRQRLAASESKLRESITFGTDVMTTSGLYGTVVGLNDDDSVQLSIAPGVEVKWAIAALRDASALPSRYRPGLRSAGEDSPSDSQSDSPSTEQ